MDKRDLVHLAAGFTFVVLAAICFATDREMDGYAFLIISNVWFAT